MKSINYLNYFLTGIPALLIIIGYLTDSDLWMAGALFSILTGLFHIVVGVSFCIETNCKPLYLFYVLGVIAFFNLWSVTDWETVMPIPPVLELYISLLIYFKAKTKKYETSPQDK